ncbi:glycoside hydrolase family 32 protein [Gracilibacillus sp. YIM 98692]|uniref:glycoside hydrolase family 32 protein n=1 Tax=Gracilibacillus sp. YIM 98692 TaxID=2663532 RepID=UPI001F09C39C|nr:glycoside hydrolase family 32 protein [Gracilibacillus sp. YIM 98692]
MGLKENSNYYTEEHRPSFHFTPQKNWMNDPNGLVYYKGEYHLFYQYHPFGMQWGPMHWGHAVSNDLLHWKHLPIALEPDELGMIFSGSVMVDKKDTTGFFGGDEGLVAFFTHHSKDEVQSQSMAYSKDNGRTWTKYEGNPIISNPGIKDFRDPKVVWHEGSDKWVMVLAVGDRVQFYGSQNLIDWDLLSEFGQGEGAHGGVWECPDLFPLNVNGDTSRTKWVLQVDLQEKAYAGGSGAQYLIGNFDGKKFINDQSPDHVNWVDYGKDFYAAQSFSDIPSEDGRRIWLAWMSNWQYANDVPTNPWRSAMTIPREVRLVEDEKGDLKLIQQPVRELDEIKMHQKNLCNVNVSPEDNPIESLQYDTCEIITQMKSIDAKEFGFKIKQGVDEETMIGYYAQEEVIFFNRTKSGSKVDFHEQFPTKQQVHLPLKDQTLQLRILVDRSSVEVFVNDGEVVLTNLILPSKTSNNMGFFVKNGNVQISELSICEIESVWN